MDQAPSNWTRMSFKGNKVWVQLDDNGKPAVSDGKILIKYNLTQDYEYRVHPDSLKSLDPENLVPKKKKPQKARVNSTSPQAGTVRLEDVDQDDDRVIHVFTDGASSGNPGPSGIGIYFRYGKHEREISRYIGQGTNNIAELTAIRVALTEIKKPGLPIRLYTDSSYALGLLTQNWKPKKNIELVEEIKALMKDFEDLTLVKVAGHAGIDGNERADQLATSAISSQHEK